MSTTLTSEIDYPSSDGKPMADNTLQFEWISTIKGNLDAQYRDDPNVFVAGDLFWYPMEGHPEIVQAPDTLVAFGRPKGYRGSYKQWQEGGVAPKVVFEVLSPNNTAPEMEKKFQFYDRHRVEEYYVYDPDRGRLSGWKRDGDELRPIAEMNGWISPLLGIRFEMNAGELTIYHPDGRRFLTFVELDEQRALEEKRRKAEEQARKFAEWERDKEKREREKAEAERLKAEAQLLKAESERLKAESERLKAEAERVKAEREKATAEADRLKAEADRLKAEREKATAEADRLKAEREKATAEAEAEKLRAQLRAAGIEPKI